MITDVEELPSMKKFKNNCSHVLKNIPSKWNLNTMERNIWRERERVGVYRLTQTLEYNSFTNSLDVLSSTVCSFFLHNS